MQALCVKANASSKKKLLNFFNLMQRICLYTGGSCKIGLAYKKCIYTYHKKVSSVYMYISRDPVVESTIEIITYDYSG